MSIFINNQRPINPIIAVIMTVLFFVALYYLAKGLFVILLWASPILFIGAAILNYKVYIDFAKKIKNRFTQNLFWGLLYLGLAIMVFPLVAAYLFIKALLSNKMKKIQQDIENEREGVYVDYEILEEEPIELPTLESKNNHNKT